MPDDTTEGTAFDPQPGDVWRDRDDHLWFAIEEQSGDFDDPDMVCENGQRGYPNDVESQFGPLVRVYRRVGDETTEGTETPRAGRRYRLSLEFGAADDRQAHRLGMAWAGTASAEWNTCNPVVRPVDRDTTEGLRERIKARIRTVYDASCAEHTTNAAMFEVSPVLERQQSALDGASQHIGDVLRRLEESEAELDRLRAVEKRVRDLLILATTVIDADDLRAALEVTDV
jgi:hypothetical protein